MISRRSSGYMCRAFVFRAGDDRKLDDGLNRWWISWDASLWTLELVANVLIQLIDICHVSTAESSAAVARTAL
jgi:hypothetical protein